MTPKLYVVLPDPQVPFHDPYLHELVLRWLSVNQPAGIIWSGDTVDLPSLSRHDWNPELVPDPHGHVRETLKATRNYLAECVQAGGEGDHWFIDGNHEVRLQKYVVKHAPFLVGLEDSDGSSTLSLSRLLNFTALGIKHQPGWPQGRVWLGDKLMVTHGWLARSASGATAKATLEKLGHSVIVGHTHRQALVFDTKHPRAGAETRVAVEAGTLATLEGGLGYAISPDWQNGFAVVRLHPDDTFYVSLATYTKGTLWWEDQRYSTSRVGVRVVA